MRKCWTRGRLETFSITSAYRLLYLPLRQWIKLQNCKLAHSKLCISMSDIQVFFRPFTPSGFVDCHRLVSLGLVPLPVSTFPWQVPHSSGISNIVGSPVKSRLHSHSSHNGLSLGLHAGTPLTHAWLSSFP